MEQNKNTKLVSVVIPTYGRNDLLERAILSVKQQTYKNIEIIVVDDNEPESLHRKETEKLMKKYENDKKIVYCKHEKNMGGCAARNTGIKQSRGEYIGFLDDDDEWTEDFLVKHLEKFEKDQAIGAVYCNYMTSHDYVHPPFLTYTKFNNKRGDIFKDLLQGWCPTSTSLFLIKKRCFEDVGFFDERLQSFQDFDMWLQLSMKYNFDYCEDFLVIKHRHAGDQVSINPKKREKGLQTLEEKWKKILKKDEWVLFEKALIKFEKNICFNKFLLEREKGKWFTSAELLKEFLKKGQNTKWLTIKSIWGLLFGVSSMNRLERWKNDFYSK